mgnify:CR=1 FL=1
MRLPILLVLAAGAAAAQSPTGDEAAVKEVVRRYVDARERRDAAAVMALFTADADQLTSTGEWRRGRRQVVEGSLASSRQTGGTRRIEVEAVRFPVQDVALADGRYEIAGTAAGGTRRMRTTLVMIRAGSGWKISAIRNMLPAASPAR